MNRARVTALLTGCAFVLSGCVSANPWVCALAVGIPAAVGGGAIGQNQTEDGDKADETAMGAVAGAIIGGTLGYFLCGGPQEKTAPGARVTCEPRSGEPPLQVSLRGTGTDPDREIKSYAWDFGDGGRSSDQHATHVYRSPGNYTATLTVTDDDGMTGTASCMVQVSGPRAAPAESRRIVLRGINFDFDKAQIKPEFEPVLDVAVQELTDNPTVNVEVAGHTDAVGTDEYNQGLSERRSNSVVDYLVSKGIDRSRLSPVGYGEAQPVADNSTADGRAQNRRVELNVR
jgi:outer membrane protein OmpA-like peptidoglycan-associated protein